MQNRLSSLFDGLKNDENLNRLDSLFHTFRGGNDMSKHRRLFAMPLCGGLLLACASLAPGQEKQVTIESGGLRITQGPEIQPPGNVAFVGAEMGLSFDGKLVKGAPYSAQAFTETTQTL